MEMSFEINYTHWKIILKPMKELLEYYKKDTGNDGSYCAGLTLRFQQEIWISEESCMEQMILVLMHELAHCWIWSYGHYYNEAVNEEDICETVSRSNSFINEIVKRFKEEIQK